MVSCSPAPAARSDRRACGSQSGGPRTTAHRCIPAARQPAAERQSGDCPSASAPTMWVMQPHRAATSSGSIAGNMAIRIWLRPSLR